MENEYYNYDYDFEDDQEDEGYQGDYSEYVTNGLDYLDRHFGRVPWRPAIDKGSLDIDDLFTCVLGQLFGGYATGTDIIGVSRSNINYDGAAAYYGFTTVYTDNRPDKMEILTRAWRNVL